MTTRHSYGKHRATMQMTPKTLGEFRGTPAYAPALPKAARNAKRNAR